jgi:hypothetical protein
MLVVFPALGAIEQRTASGKGPPMTIDEAYRASVTSSIPQIAEDLQTTLGQRLTAYAVGVRDPKAVGKYARAAIEPREETAQRLRDLFRIVRLLDEERPETIRAWLIGSNPLLADKAPIEVLHEENTHPVNRAAGDVSIPFSSAAFKAVHEAGTRFVAKTA